MSQKKDKQKILFFRESAFKVAELIFNYPNSTFHIRNLAKRTGLSTTAISSAVNELQKFNIISVRKNEITTDIKADLESEAYFFYKKIFNLYRLEHYNLISELKETFNAKAIVLFGSFAKGEDIEESDIDILIITNSKNEKVKMLNIWEKEFNRKINLHILQSVRRSSAEFKNAICNGIVLYGYIQVI